MSLFQTVTDYCANDDKEGRAVFEAAMIDRIQTKGYKMSDLMYEVYLCQKAIGCLQTECISQDERLVCIESEKFKSKKKGK